MSRYVDPQASTQLTSDEVTNLRLGPEIGKLKELRDRLSKEVRSESGTIKRAEAAVTKICLLYQKASDALDCAKEKLMKSGRKHARTYFFNTINTIEINKQLEDSSLLGLDADERKPPKVEYHLEERSRLRISFAWRHPI
jgi:Protein of unknown function (DUF3435)